MHDAKKKLTTYSQELNKTISIRVLIFYKFIFYFKDKSDIKRIQVDSVSQLARIQFHGKQFSVIGESNATQTYIGDKSHAKTTCQERSAKLPSVHYWGEFHL